LAWKMLVHDAFHPAQEALLDQDKDGQKNIMT
jgi:hypothetical protein